MGKESVKKQAYLVFPSETGKNHYILFKRELIQKAGIDKLIDSIGSATTSFGSCIRGGRAISSARRKKRPKSEKSFKGRLRKDYTKTKSKLKQSQSLVKKLIKSRTTSDRKRIQDIDLTKIQERFLSLDLSSGEKSVFEKEFAKMNEILQQEDDIRLLEYLKEKLEEMDNLDDVEKEFVPRSIIGGILLGIAIVVAVVVVAVIAVVVWNEIIVPFIEDVIDFGENLIDEVTDAGEEVVEEVVEEVGVITDCVYVANPNTKEIHDCANRQIPCYLDLMKNPIYLETKAEALEYINNQGYNGCAWCFTEYDTG